VYKQFYEILKSNYESRLVAHLWSVHDVKKRLDLLSSSPQSQPFKEEPAALKASEQEHEKDSWKEANLVPVQDKEKEQLEDPKEGKEGEKKKQFSIGDSPPLSPMKPRQEENGSK